MSSVDGGSAAPPTADVPTEDRLLPGRVAANDNCVAVHMADRYNDPVVLTPAEARAFAAEVIAAADSVDDRLDPPSPNAEALRIAMGWDKLPRMTPARRRRFDEENARVQAEAAAFYAKQARSGVAGEPEATTKEAPEIAVAVSPTPTHAPTPETPGAVNVAGGVTVPDEAVEAYRVGYGRSFRKENRTDRDDVRAGLTAAAPLIVEHYLRATYWALRERSSAFRSAGGNEPHARGLDEAAALVEGRLAELERGGDHA